MILKFLLMLVNLDRLVEESSKSSKKDAQKKQVPPKKESKEPQKQNASPPPEETPKKQESDAISSLREMPSKRREESTWQKLEVMPQQQSQQPKPMEKPVEYQSSTYSAPAATPSANGAEKVKANGTKKDEPKAITALREMPGTPKPGQGAVTAPGEEPIESIKSAPKKEEKKPDVHIDDKVISVDLTTKRTDAEYKKLEQVLETYRNNLESQLYKPTMYERLKTVVKQIPTFARNVYDNTAGVIHASLQNSKTARQLKKDPEKDITYFVRGRAQNIGPGWRMGKIEQQRGRLPYHLRTNYDQTRSTEERLKNLYNQIDELHKKAGIKDPQRRNDGATGHSSGANMLYFASQDPTNPLPKRGIYYTQGVAGSPYGIPIDNFVQKAMAGLVDLSDEDVKTSSHARAEAVKVYQKGRPDASHEAVVGEYDYLATPKFSADPHLSKMHVLRGPKTGHFHTSGSGPQEVNELLSDLLTKQRQHSYKMRLLDEYKPNDSYQAKAA